MKAMSDGTQAKDIPANDLEGLTVLMKEINEIGVEFEKLRVVEDGATKNKKFLEDYNAPAGRPALGDPDTKGQQRQVKSLGEMFAEGAFKDGQRILRKDTPLDLVDADFKTLMQRSAGWAPFVQRSDRVVMSAQRPPQVIDAIPVGTTDQTASKYMRETTFTNNADITAEAAVYPEGALVLTEVGNTVQKIAVFLPVTDEQLEDVAGIKSYIDNRLELMLMQRVDYKLINGAGGGSDIEGFLNVSGIQTQARGTDPPLDALLKAATKVRSTPGFANPSGYFLNPTDLMNLRLTRTTDGIYILGNPSDAGPLRLWGLPVTESVVLAAGTGLVGDWIGYTQFSVYRGVTIMITNSNEDDFKKGKQCIRADMRGVLDTYRSTAICSITGL